MQSLKMFSSQLGNIKIKTEKKEIISHKLTDSVHSHANFEYIFILKGRLIMSYDDKYIELAENDSVLIFPGKYHVFTSISGKYKVAALKFSMKRVPAYHETDSYSTLKQKLSAMTDKIIFYSKDDKRSELCGLLSAYNEADTFFRNDSTSALLTLIYTHIFEPLLNNEINRVDYNAETNEDDLRNHIIDDYFFYNYREDISLKTLADILHLSTKQTARIIQRIYGKSFRECLTQKRLQIAKQLLAATDKDAKDIAFDVGFKSYNGFYMAFKNSIGITPLEYRKKQTIIQKENDNQ